MAVYASAAILNTKKNSDRIDGSGIAVQWNGVVGGGFIVYVQAKLMCTQAPICKCAITCTITHVRNCSISYSFRKNCIFSKFPKYKKQQQTYIQNEYVHTQLYTCKTSPFPFYGLLGGILLRTECNTHKQLWL